MLKKIWLYKDVEQIETAFDPILSMFIVQSSPMMDGSTLIWVGSKEGKK
ncbi:hypothetical protein [Paenibacillus lautus]|nr:hypothetical protein [Paenibacillus lautus]MBX4148391.1 hypothetical protein [Paenibacillus lautus]